MDFNYFQIPTRIIQGYDSHIHLREIPELSKKRVILISDYESINLGATQNLRRYIENYSFGLISYQIASEFGEGLSDDALALVRDSKAQTLVGFGNTHILSIARAMAQFGSTEQSPISYIEIPSLPCIYPGLFETYYVAASYDTFKNPYKDANSRADWLILDSSYSEYMRVDEILESSVFGLTCAFDALLARDADMLAESYALKAIELYFSAGMRLASEPTNIKLKSELMHATLLTSFAIQSSSMGIGVGLAMALENNVICSESRGAGAVLLSVLEYSLVTNIDKFQKLGRILDIKENDPITTGMKFLEAVQSLLSHMEIRPLSYYSYTKTSLGLVAKQAARYRFMVNLSRPAGFYELSDILDNASKYGISISTDLVDTDLSKSSYQVATPKQEDVTVG